MQRQDLRAATLSSGSRAGWPWGHCAGAPTNRKRALPRMLDEYYLRHASTRRHFFGHQATMQTQSTWAAGSFGEEDWLLSAQCGPEAYFPRLAKARPPGTR